MVCYVGFRMIIHKKAEELFLLMSYSNLKSTNCNAVDHSAIISVLLGNLKYLFRNYLERVCSLETDHFNA